jgi:alanyl-tRNA synthetase
VVVLDRTPFYAESGGQVGDTGYLSAEGVRAEVTDTTKAQGHHLHHVRVLEGTLAVGDRLQGSIDNRCARRPGSITRPRTCCTRRCARCWAST